MKQIFLCSTMTIALALAAEAAVSYNFTFGALRDTAGNQLPDNTLLVLIADTDSTSGLPGGLNGTDLSDSGLDPASAYSEFAGKMIDVGYTINGDTVLYVGHVNAGTFNYPAGTYYSPNTKFDSYPGAVAGGQNYAV